MRIIKWLVILLVLVIVVAIVAVTSFLGPIIKTAVENAGPSTIGVPLALAKADVSIRSGQVDLENFAVGNPEGFKSENLFKVARVHVDLDVPSVVRDTIVIREILIDAPEITFEQTLAGNNIGKLLAGLEEKGKAGEQKEGEKKEEEKGKPEGAAKKVVIENFLITNGKIRLSALGLGDNSIPIPLPTIHLQNIGKESNGASVKEVITQVVKAIVESVTKAITSSGQLLKGTAEGVGKGVKVTGEVVEGVAKKSLETAGGAAKEVGGTITKGAGKAVDGLKGLFKK